MGQGVDAGGAGGPVRQRQDVGQGQEGFLQLAELDAGQGEVDLGFTVVGVQDRGGDIGFGSGFDFELAVEGQAQAVGDFCGVGPLVGQLQPEGLGFAVAFGTQGALGSAEQPRSGVGSGVGSAVGGAGLLSGVWAALGVNGAAIAPPPARPPHSSNASDPFVTSRRSGQGMAGERE